MEWQVIYVQALYCHVHTSQMINIRLHRDVLHFFLLALRHIIKETE